MVGTKEAKEKEMKEPLTEIEIEQEIAKMRIKKRKEVKDTTRPPPNKKRRKWRIEFRKDLQQKRKRHFSQAEEEEEEIVKRRKRKLAKTDTIDGEAHNKYQPKNSNTQSTQSATANIEESNAKKKEKIEKENISFFPIFNFTATRQKGDGENSHKCKANSKLSCAANHPHTKLNHSVKVNVKSTPSPSSTPNQPMQAQWNFRKKLKAVPYQYKPLNQHFFKINQEQGLEGLTRSESKSLMTPTTTNPTL